MVVKNRYLQFDTVYFHPAKNEVFLMNKCNHQENKNCFLQDILEIPHRADFLFREVNFGSGLNTE